MKPEMAIERGVIGLARMGANMTERLVMRGHRAISFDRSPQATQRVVDMEPAGAHSLADFVKQPSLPHQHGHWHALFKRLSDCPTLRNEFGGRGLKKG